MSNRPLLWLGLVAVVGCGVEGKTRTTTDSQTREAPFPELVSSEVIQLGGGRDQEHIVPLMLELQPAQWLEFVTLDRRVHTVSFVADSLSDDGLEYLVRTGQMSGPPLLERGARFLVDLREAPAGRYVFSSTSHGQPVYGRVEIRGDTADR